MNECRDKCKLEFREFGSREVRHIKDYRTKCTKTYHACEHQGPAALPYQCCEGMDAKISKKACYLA